jgi:hypothetical protein
MVYHLSRITLPRKLLKTLGFLGFRKLFQSESAAAARSIARAGSCRSTVARLTVSLGIVPAASIARASMTADF